MKKSSWKKFFTKSRSKSGSRSKNSASVSEPTTQNEDTSSVAIENKEPIVQKLVAEKPLEAEVMNPVASAVQDAGPPLKQESRMNSSTSQPISSTNQDFMAEEVDSQISSINSQASEKPANVTDLDLVQDVDQADSSVMVRHPAFSESVPSNEGVDSTQTSIQETAVEQAFTSIGTAVPQQLSSVGETEMILESEAPESEDRESGDPDSRTMTDGAQPEEREAAQTLMVVEDVKFENARTASDDEGEFAVDRSQPQQLSKLDVLGPDLQINPNYSESDDSQKPVAQPFDITNNFVTTDYQLSETGESGNQSILSETDCESDSAAIVLELPTQLLNKDERPSRDAESLRGAEMLFFSGVTNSGTGQENMTPILFFGPQAGNFVEEKIVYQVASGRHTDDSYHVSQASLPRSQISNDGQSPPTLEYEDEDQHNSRDIVKKM